MKLLTLFMIPVIAACSTQLPADNRSPEQIAASAKDKSATVECYYITSVYGVVRTVRVGVDKSSLGNSGATISTDPEGCRATISILPPLPRPVAASSSGATP